MKKQRRGLVHFLSPDTRELLCKGKGDERSGAAVKGIAVCAICARAMAEQVERAPEPTILRPPAR
jgi:hypothetical protein